MAASTSCGDRLWWNGGHFFPGVAVARVKAGKRARHPLGFQQGHRSKIGGDRAGFGVRKHSGRGVGMAAAVAFSFRTANSYEAGARGYDERPTGGRVGHGRLYLCGADFGGA